MRGESKEFRIRPGADQRPGILLQALAGNGQRHAQHAAIGKFQRRDLAVAFDRHSQSGGQRIGHGNADAVQAAGEGIGAVAAGLVELAAGVQAGEHDYDCRFLLGWMRTNRNATSVVLNRYRTIQMHAHCKGFGVTGQRLVSGVVDHFLDDVRRRVGAGVHARPRAHRLQAFEHADGRFVVLVQGIKKRGFKTLGTGKPNCKLRRVRRAHRSIFAGARGAPYGRHAFQ
jgi:hypothetical protein